MPKTLNSLLLTIFIFVASAAPYVSARGAALAFAQNPEERDLSNQPKEKEIFRQEITSLVVKITIHEILFPSFIVIKAQAVFDEILRPPIA
jgi:hypothetical protein